MKIVTFILFFAVVFGKTAWHQLDNYSFSLYVREFNKNYKAEEYTMRQAIFEKKLAAMKLHNADMSKSWKQGVNQFTDRTEEEFRKVLGVRKELIQPNHAVPTQAFDLTTLPNHRDWREENIITSVKDQGQCGSCWTFGTAETLESYWAMSTGQLVDLSEQQILDCTANPNQCGGTGGCGGGTAELAFDQIKKLGGLSTEWTYPYNSYFGANFQCHFNASMTQPFASISGYVKLPSNFQQPVLQHVATNGPLAITVDASAWSDYEGGVFDGCNQTNPDLDHEVQLVGYGTDHPSGKDYWIVRNSWSPIWGEQGYIRILRTAVPRCGIDLNPSDGTGCKNGPKTVRVCGTCGILYDSVYPVIQT